MMQQEQIATVSGATNCHMHCALQGARDRIVLDEKKGFWLGTLLKAFDTGNIIAICSKKN